jgi:hypothetical protein
MKKVKDLTIKTKFPCISEERKNLIMLLKNSNINSKPLNKNEKNKIKPLKHFKSVDLLEALTPRYEHRKKPLSKIFSRNNLYLTKLPPPSDERRGGSTYYENFGSQIIPPYKKKFREKMQNKNKKKKIKYKELQYIGNILGLSKTKYKENIEKRNIIPLETRKDYHNYIRHKRNLFFNPNSTSNYVHEKSSNYLISSIIKSKEYSILYKNNKRLKDNKEEALELRDKVPNMSYEQNKMMKKIKNLFSQDFKFNNILFKEDFYHKNENKINFLQDIFRVPVLKNNLVKIKFDKNLAFSSSEWKKISAINHQTWDFLMQLKRKIQREKDEKNQKLQDYLNKKRQKEKEYELLNKNNKNKNKEKNEIEIQDEENYKKIIDDIIESEVKKEKNMEDLYTAEEYFLRRNNYFDDKVSIANDNLRNIFFTKQ